MYATQISDRQLGFVGLSQTLKCPLVSSSCCSLVTSVSVHTNPLKLRLSYHNHFSNMQQEINRVWCLVNNFDCNQQIKSSVSEWHPPVSGIMAMDGDCVANLILHLALLSWLSRLSCLTGKVCSTWNHPPSSFKHWTNKIYQQPTLQRMPQWSIK